MNENDAISYRREREEEEKEQIWDGQGDGQGGANVGKTAWSHLAWGMSLKKEEESIYGISGVLRCGISVLSFQSTAIKSLGIFSF